MFRKTPLFRLLAVAFLLLPIVAIAPPETALAAGNYIVTTTSDALPGNCTATPSSCSLRQAILSADSDGVDSTIQFSIPGAQNDLRIIALTSVLPTISSPTRLTITGSASNLGFPNIVIDGGGNLTYGLRITSANNTIERLIINNFRSSAAPNGVGIWVTGTSARDNRILSNYIGNRPLDTAAYANTRGIQVDSGASGTILGGSIDNTGERNTISGNNFNGVYVFGAINTRIRGNYIGVALDSSGALAALGNRGPGIEISDSTDTIIGGLSLGQRNLIVSNGDNPTTGAGVLISGSGTSGTQVIGNSIGVSTDGVNPLGNNGDGVRIQDGARDTTISSGPDRSIISGNTGYGVRIVGENTRNVQITNSYIGMNRNGNAAIANDRGGVRIEDNAFSNTVGPGNVISGNTGYGVSIGLTLPTATEVVSQTIIGSVIGLNAAGDASFPNTSGGIQIEPAVRQIRIGGASEAERNTISGNTGYAIHIRGSSANTIIGNHIGLNMSGTRVFTNTIGGLFITPGTRNAVEFGVNENRIGGSGAGEGNVIAGNGGPAVVISGTNALTNSVVANTIGLRRATVGGALNTAAGNGGPGIWLAGGPQTTTIASNTVVHSTGDGIRVEGGVVTTTIQSNLVGVTVGPNNVLQDRGNSGNGIALLDGSRNTTLQNNNVGFQRSANVSGIAITGALTTTISGGSILTNTTGINISNSYTTTITGLTVQRSTGTGINITDSYTTTLRDLTVQHNAGGGIVVGGESRYAPITASRIRNNGVVGVRLAGNAQQVRITDNVITRNAGAGQGIRLQAGTNGGIAPPAELRLTQNRILTGRINVDAASAGACITCTIQIFTADPAVADRQGNAFVDTPIAIDANGAFTATLPVGLGLPRQLALTATDGYSNTSEFAAFDTLFNRNSLQIAPARSGPASPGATITYAHRITNTSTIDFVNDVRLRVNSQLGWTATITPNTLLTLRAGASLPVTVTLTLPTGSAENVRAGLQERTRVTIESTTLTTVTTSITDTTTVNEQFVLAVAPTRPQTGSGLPTTSVPYIYTLSNNGNITRTVTLTATTGLTPAINELWRPTVSPLSVQIGPGRTADVTLSVRVPQDAQAGELVTTTLRADVAAPDQAESRVVTATTTAALEQLATLTPNRQGFAAASGVITFVHTVTNLSNGEATFRLSGGSSLGSRIRYVSNTQGVSLIGGDTFTISNVAGANRFEFFVEVTVDRRALPGQTDLVTISLADQRGTKIGGASAQNIIVVTRGNVLPRIFQPMVLR